MALFNFDYIVVGGGLCGCVVASRLKQAFPLQSVAIIEAGSDARRDPAISNLSAAITLVNTEFLHSYDTVPQSGLNGKRVALASGKVLGGGSAVNYGVWTRGDRSGYNEWAKVVGDSQWSYESLLPYFKRSETVLSLTENAQHGFNGPIKISSTDRGYPLRDAISNAMAQAGHEFNLDMNGGSTKGFAQVMETWDLGKRTYAANAYPMDGIDIFADCRAVKILFESARAVGVKLADGRVIAAQKEIVVSCGAIRTPQLLQLSGIGPREELEKLGISVLVDAPSVGQNLHDHPISSLQYELRHADRGLAIGSDKFNDPKFFLGNPTDFFLTTTTNNRSSLREDDIEISILYVSRPVPDGKHIFASVCGLTTTSRGQVKLKSLAIEDDPIVDVNYLFTEHDRNMMHAGVRELIQIMSTNAGQEMVTTEVPPPGFDPLTAESKDAEIDARVRESRTTYHYAGTAAMGAVVDTECRVKGVTGLRVVDASILPVCLGAHLQAPLYGIAEKSSALIIDSNQ